jgi:hypothetical protein
VSRLCIAASGYGAAPTTPLRWDPGIKQGYDRRVHGVRRTTAVVVHSCDDCGAVVKQG